MKMKNIEQLSKQLNLKSKVLNNIINMIDEGLTFHFILRYRKSETEDIDESLLREVFDRVEYNQKLDEKRNSLLDTLEEKGVLTDAVKRDIECAELLKDIDLIASKYREKREINSQKGIDYGFIPMVEKLIRFGNLPNKDFINSKKDGEKYFNALLVSELSLNLKSRKFIKDSYLNYGKIEVKGVDKESINNKNYKVYIDRILHIKYLKSFQMMAINRGVKEKVLKKSLIIDEINRERYIKYYSRIEKYSSKVIKEVYRRVLKSVENEIFSELTEKAELESCEFFKRNLKSLLLAKPVKGKSILAVDPGFKNGCKFALIDSDQNPKLFGKFYIGKGGDLPPRDSFDLLVLGNGTASKEAYNYLYERYKKDIYIVNEAGASVYSTCDAAIEEFPNLDPLERGTLSIGRRFLDSMAELVKIPVHSLGVGMYQHDVKKGILEKKLSESIEDVVNFCGVDLNSASIYLLKNISGLDKRSAKKLVNNKPYRSRLELKKILSEKAFKLSTGFLRVPESDNFLDNTTIHPENYEVAESIAGDIKSNTLKSYKDYGLDSYTFNFIVKEIKSPGSSSLKRLNEAMVIKPINSDELMVGLRVKGIVRNIVPFGLYIDFGFKNDGLLHISKIPQNYNGIESFSSGESVKVEIIEVDGDRCSLKLVE
ncbi:MAG: hypothetical protein CR982_01540 [Candidatus Cloacimonadota bacterium]|nr:MAG: hypothetical protein CR982_01540 [Candidatus Cloacimonadota bacterium]PIE78910.1 MAG: hypothetical protein CSA15_05405 [Candidatus Delongbacteria bacterium]